jgi:hypothetical protein
MRSVLVLVLSLSPAQKNTQKKRNIDTEGTITIINRHEMAVCAECCVLLLCGGGGGGGGL